MKRCAEEDIESDSEDDIESDIEEAIVALADAVEDIAVHPRPSLEACYSLIDSLSNCVGDSNGTLMLPRLLQGKEHSPETVSLIQTLLEALRTLLALLSTLNSTESTPSSPPESNGHV